MGRSPAALGERHPTPAPRASVVLLRSLPWFDALSDGHAAYLAERAHLRRYRRGEFIVRQGQRSDALMVLLSGRAMALREGDKARSVLLRVLQRGDRIGELGLIDGGAETAGVRCAATSEVLALQGADVLHCMSQSPAWADALALELVRQLRGTNRRIASLALQEVRDRLLWHLVDMAQPRPDGMLQVPYRVNRTELSMMVGASREMVSRVMSALERDGQVATQPDGTVLLPMPAGQPPWVG